MENTVISELDAKYPFKQRVRLVQSGNKYVPEGSTMIIGNEFGLSLGLNMEDTGGEVNLAITFSKSTSLSDRNGKILESSGVGELGLVRTNLKSTDYIKIGEKYIVTFLQKRSPMTQTFDVRSTEPIKALETSWGVGSQLAPYISTK
ncbi:MAG TPA: hypothetical protein VHE53_05725 [Patescibacteria group bacterium]|nr:hypothetical protein [Patescibacteria group bacterium]